MDRHDRYVELISGRRTGIVADAQRLGLAGLSLAYGAAMRVRNAWYSSAPGAARRVRVPVISIGNITTGGTGKTPMAAWFAQRLEQSGRRVGILTRGYRGRPIKYDDTQRELAQSQWRIESDEAEVLRRLCPRARVIIDPDRVAGAQRAMRDGCDALVLDDGFQHRRLRRDLDVVLIDATNPFGFGHVLPRGLLREPRSGLRRADVIVLTRVDQVNEAERTALASALADDAPGVRIVCARHSVTGLFDVLGRPVTDIDMGAVEAVIFAGVGNFAAFRGTVERLGIKVLAAYSYPDHHDYSDQEMITLAQVASAMEANALVTTEKDAVKLIGRWQLVTGRDRTDEVMSATPLFALRVEMAFEAEDAAYLGELVQRACAAGGGRAS